MNILKDSERTYCYNCEYEHSIEEIEYDLADNEHCCLCGELLDVLPDFEERSSLTEGNL